MNRDELASKIDATLVQTNHDISQINELIEAARKYRFACCFTLPCYSSYVKEQLKGTGVHTGIPVGFPSGGETTEAKCFQAEEAVRLQVEEVDMVINVGWLLSGFDDKVTDEIRRIKDIVGERPLKCIIEASLYTEDQIKRASLCVLKGGADYVKTGTGWLAPASLEDVRVIRQTVGDELYIKAAGGIRTFENAAAFLEAGVYRLGIGVKSAVNILENM